MQLLRSFRLSIYVTLGIACICLDYAEGGLLPETPYITGFVICLLVVGYHRLEGRAGPCRFMRRTWSAPR